MIYGKYPALDKVKKILVVKMRHHGDVLLTSPVFSNLKKSCPDASIDAYIYKDTLPMLEGHPAIDGYHLYDRAWKKLSFFKRAKEELALLYKIRKERYDLVINLTEGDRGAIVALTSGCSLAVGFEWKKKGFFGKSRAFSHLVKVGATPRHTVETQLDALRCLGIFPEPHERDLSLHIPQKAFDNISLSNYVVVHPVSRWLFKCPPAKLMAEVIEELERKGKRVVLTSGPDKMELEMLEKIISYIPNNNVLNLGGKISLKELGALIQKAEGLITVDSVPLHIASALKTPVAVLFGPSSETIWGPWMHPKSRVIAKSASCRPCLKDGCGGSKVSDCLYTLSVDEIMQQIDQIFNLK